MTSIPSKPFLCRDCGETDPTKFKTYSNGRIPSRRLCKQCRYNRQNPSRVPRVPQRDHCLCDDCGISDPLAFRIYPTGKSNRRCRRCESARESERRKQKYQQAHQWIQAQEKPLLYPRQQMPIYLYVEITEQDIALLLWAQEGLCKICKSPLTIEHHKYATDHDHETGEVRGILCNLCNQGLGSFRDNPVFLRNAADYLEAYYEGYLEANGWTRPGKKKRKFS